MSLDSLGTAREHRSRDSSVLLQDLWQVTRAHRAEGPSCRKDSGPHRAGSPTVSGEGTLSIFRKAA